MRERSVGQCFFVWRTVETLYYVRESVMSYWRFTRDSLLSSTRPSSSCKLSRSVSLTRHQKSESQWDREFLLNLRCLTRRIWSVSEYFLHLFQFFSIAIHFSFHSIPPKKEIEEKKLKKTVDNLYCPNHVSYRAISFVILCHLIFYWLFYTSSITNSDSHFVSSWTRFISDDEWETTSLNGFTGRSQAGHRPVTGRSQASHRPTRTGALGPKFWMIRIICHMDLNADQAGH